MMIKEEGIVNVSHLTFNVILFGDYLIIFAASQCTCFFWTRGDYFSDNKLLATKLTDHYSNVAWAPWRPKTQVTDLCIQEFLQTLLWIQCRSSALLFPLSGESNRRRWFASQRTSNAEASPCHDAIINAVQHPLPDSLTDSLTEALSQTSNESMVVTVTTGGGSI